MDLDALIKKMQGFGARIEAAEKVLASLDPNLLQGVMDAAKALDPELLAKLAPTIDEVGNLLGEVKTVTDQVTNIVGQLDSLAQRVSALEGGKVVTAEAHMGQGELNPTLVAGVGTASGEAKVGG